TEKNSPLVGWLGRVLWRRLLVLATQRRGWRRMRGLSVAHDRRYALAVDFQKLRSLGRCHLRSIFKSTERDGDGNRAIDKPACVTGELGMGLGLPLGLDEFR